MKNAFKATMDNRDLGARAGYLRDFGRISHLGGVAG
jgi:hypothetical protein